MASHETAPEPMSGPASEFKRPDPQSILDGMGDFDHVLGADSDEGEEDEFQDAEVQNADSPSVDALSKDASSGLLQDSTHSSSALSHKEGNHGQQQALFNADDPEADPPARSTSPSDPAPAPAPAAAAPADSVSQPQPQAETETEDYHPHQLGFSAPSSSEPYPTVASSEKPTASEPTAFKPTDPKPTESNSADSARSSAELEAEVAELQQQVTSLNSKLVQSFERMAETEDDLMESRILLQRSTHQIASLTKIRAEHLAALSTGALLKKEGVSAEMQRMMNHVLEETQQRGKAESDRRQIQAELDELSSSLFKEANQMVASERLTRSRAQDKSQEMERALNQAESSMWEQQRVLAALQRKMELLQRNGPGSTVHPSDTPEQLHRDAAGGPGIDSLAQPLSEQDVDASRLMDIGSAGALIPSGLVKEQIHLNTEAFREFVAFLSHLRRQRLSLKPFYEYNPAPGAEAPVVALEDGTQGATTKPSASNLAHPDPFAAASVARHRDFPSLPATADSLIQVSTQLSSHAFLRRTQEEDVEPCLRLDAAPGLGWLNRRSVHTALLDGHLVIEPIFPGTAPDSKALRERLAHAPLAPCALCGMGVLNVLHADALPGGGAVVDRKPSSGWASLSGSAASLLEKTTGGLRSHHASGSGEMDQASSTDELDHPTSAAPPGNAAGSDGAAGHARSHSDKSTASSKRSFFSGLKLGSASPKPERTLSPAPAGLSFSRLGAGSIGSNNSGTTEGKTPDLSVDFEPTIPTHIFRISEGSSNRYLLCPQHCLSHLRAACAFWGWVRRLQREIVLEGKQPWKHAQIRASAGDPELEESSPVLQKPEPPTADTTADTTEGKGEATTGEAVEQEPTADSFPSASIKWQGTDDRAHPSDPAATEEGHGDTHASGRSPAATPAPPPAAAHVDSGTSASPQHSRPSSPAAPRTQETITLTAASPSSTATWEEGLYQELLAHKLAMALARAGCVR